MSTIPLFQTPPLANAWHAVRSPGGFEWWHFDATSDDGSVHVGVNFYDGDPFDPAYARAYLRYRNHPTRHAPPTPAEYRRVEATIDRAGKSPQIFSADGVFCASFDRISVIIGQSQFQIDVADVLRVIAGGEGGVDLSFAKSPIATPFSLHPNLQWILAAPHSRVSGTIRIDGHAVPFSGVGYHEHYVSTAPLGESITQWFRGRLFVGDETLAFHQISFADGSEHAAVRLIRADAAGVAEQNVQRATMKIKPSAPWKPAFPISVQISDDLTLSNPTVLATSAGRIRFAYEASYLGRGGVALCESIRPRRLR